MRKKAFLLLLLCYASSPLHAQSFLIIPDQLFDGEEMLTDWAVLVEGNQIKQVGPAINLKRDAPEQIIRLEGTTLIPGMIEGHSHLLLHPYDETSWNDQVLVESQAERVLRAGVHAEKTLLAGFTTVRDLGSEGAGYADVGIKQAIEKGIIAGPRMIVAGRAIVATGSYGPKGFAPHVHVPLGAEAADAHNLVQVVRDQIGHGADLIKIYADYRWGPNKEAQPTFTESEWRLIMETTQSSGREVVAHAATAEGMLRAASAGVTSIEHGDGGTREVYEVMIQNQVALCPTLAAPEAISQYRGWKKGIDPDPARIQQKKESFRLALEMGVPIIAGGDAGVFDHGDNVIELELMVEYGMSIQDVLKSVTSGNADLLGLSAELGRVKAGLLADLVAVEGDPSQDISVLRKVTWVMKDGKIYVP